MCSSFTILTILPSHLYPSKEVKEGQTHLTFQYFQFCYFIFITKIERYFVTFLTDQKWNIKTRGFEAYIAWSGYPRKYVFPKKKFLTILFDSRTFPIETQFLIEFEVKWPSWLSNGFYMWPPLWKAILEKLEF